MHFSEQDRKQQELLKELDKELFTYTGQIPWLLPGIFSFISIVLGAIPINEDLKLSILEMVYMMCMLVLSVLSPYMACNEFGLKKKKTDVIYNKIKYIPVSRKNFIYVRMEYLFKYLWKLCAIELFIHIIISIAGRVYTVNDYLYVVFFMFVFPMALGWVSAEGYR
jgi:hypothetical protein